MNYPDTRTNPALAALRRHISGAIERGAAPIVEIPTQAALDARKPRPSVCLSCGHAIAYGSTAGGCPCTEEDRKRAAQALARIAFPEGVKP